MHPAAPRLITATRAPRSWKYLVMSGGVLYAGIKHRDLAHIQT